MATHRIPILNLFTKPDNSGNVFWEPFSVKATNDVWDHGVWVFNDTATRLLLYGSFLIPKNFVSTPSVILPWSASVTTGNVVWDFDYRAIGGDNAESLDQVGTQEALTVTDAAPTAAWNRLTASVNLTAANLAADDLVQFLIARDGADAADTMAAAALLFGAWFQYNDT